MVPAWRNVNEGGLRGSEGEADLAAGMAADAAVELEVEERRGDGGGGLREVAGEGVLLHRYVKALKPVKEG